VTHHPDSGAQARFQACTDSLLTRLGAPGITAAAVTSSGDILLAAAGFADVERKIAMSPQHRMLGGSTGKSIFAATALMLVRQGVLDLDAPLSRALGTREWFSRLPNAYGLTLRLLLSHSSGLPDHMGRPGLMDELKAIVKRDGPDGYLRPEEGVAMILDQPPMGAPGERFFYSDTNYHMAGLAIEAVTGRDLYDIASELVLTPADMDQTEPAVRRGFAGLAMPYSGSPEAGFQRNADMDGMLPYSPRMEWAGGGFVTSSRDLALFIHRYASGGAAGAAGDQVANPVRFSWGEGHLAAYGLGLFLNETSLGRAIGHGGYYPGYRSQMTWYREHDLAVAWQVNASAPFDGYSDIVTQRVEAAAKAIDPSEPLSQADDAATGLAAAILGQTLGV
jgi:D-alanyl-D-alanine carboxypeptidase